jgi:hypothetical protein
MPTPARPRWTTLNLAALWLAVSASSDPRTPALALPRRGGGPVLRGLLATLGGPPPPGQLLDGAVVRERVAGASWSAIAEDLRIDPAVAEARFSDAERAFREAEAFPVRREPDGRLRRSCPAVLHNPDEWARRLAVRRGRIGTADLDVDDATWRAHERVALALMDDLVARDALPEGVDRVEARLRLEDRRVAYLAHELARTRPEDRPAALLETLEESTDAIRDLAARMTAVRRPVRSLAQAASLAA